MGDSTFRASVTDDELATARNTVNFSEDKNDQFPREVVDVLIAYINDLEGAIRAALLADDYHPDIPKMLSGEDLLACFEGVVKRIKPSAECPTSL